MGHIQHESHVRGLAARSEEICRCRDGPAQRLPRIETARKHNSYVGEKSTPRRRRRPSHRALHRHQQTRRSEEVAGRAGKVPNAKTARTKGQAVTAHMLIVVNADGVSESFEAALPCEFGR